jgi:hypothetical protein
MIPLKAPCCGYVGVQQSKLTSIPVCFTASSSLLLQQEPLLALEVRHA